MSEAPQRFMARDYYNDEAATHYCPSCKALHKRGLRHGHWCPCSACAARLKLAGPYILLQRGLPKESRLAKAARMGRII